MKNSKKYILIFAVLCFSACKKDQFNENPKSDSNKIDYSSVAYSLPGRQLTNVQIDSIAIMHNNFLIEVISNYDLLTTNNDSEMLSHFITIGINNFSLSASGRLAFLDSSNNNNYQFVANHSDDADVIIIMDDAHLFLVNNPSCNFSDIQDFIDDEKTFANSNIAGSDLVIALAFLATFEKSSYLWMPFLKGGSGVGSAFLIDLEEANPGVAINWGDILEADGRAACGVLLRTWYMAGFGPLSWGSIVGAIGWGCAWGSGYAILSQLWE